MTKRCRHKTTKEGPRQPAVYGSWETEVCCDCGRRRVGARTWSRWHFTAKQEADAFAEAWITYGLEKAAPKSAKVLKLVTEMRNKLAQHPSVFPDTDTNDD